MKPNLLAASVLGAACVLSPGAASAQEPSGQLLRDIGGDYVHFVSADTAWWLRVGGSAALGIHAGDEAISNAAPSRHLKGGHEYGGVKIQAPLAIGWWVVGHAVGPEHAEAGRDLLRAQISAASWTYGLKFIVNRERPNGDPRSFPSGHASATFATAIVLQQHYGWKVGAPALAAAVYTSASRITARKHWASDVMFGSAIGIASARTVTVRLRGTDVTVAPVAVGGGGGISFSVARRPS